MKGYYNPQVGRYYYPALHWAVNLVAAAIIATALCVAW